MTRIMIDLETASTETNAAILAVGAVSFDIGVDSLAAGIKPGSCFYATIPLEWYYENTPPWEYDISRDTLDWWNNQSDLAREALTESPVEYGPRSLCEALTAWIVRQGLDRMGEGEVWANSPTFDLAILRHMYGNECHMGLVQYTEGGVIYNRTVPPWHFRQERDYRTYRSVFPKEAGNAWDDVSLSGQFVGHRADHDAIRQARVIQIVEAQRRATRQ